MTNAERIIEVLKNTPGLDDDELAEAAGVSPRQTVNGECRHLESQGRLIRFPGPTGKIVNHLVGPYGEQFDDGWQRTAREDAEELAEAARLRGENRPSGWIVVDQNGWIQAPRSLGEVEGDGAHTPRLMSKMEADDFAARWRERWQDQCPDAKVQVCPVYAGSFISD